MADTMTSPEFRKRYPRLTQPVVVTALGRVIGEWFPAGTEPLVASPAVAERRKDLRAAEMTASTRPTGDAYRKVAARPKA